LKKIGDSIYFRLQELTQRPKAVETVFSSINATIHFLVNVSTTLETKEGEIEDILELCQNVITWLDIQQEEQNKLLPHETPAFTSKEVYTKGKQIEDKVKAILRRPKKKIPKPEITLNNTESNATVIDENVTEEQDPDTNQDREPDTDQDIESKTTSHDEL